MRYRPLTVTLIAWLLLAPRPGTSRDRVFATIGGHYVEFTIDLPPGC